MERNLGKRGKITDENGEKLTSRIGLNENDIEVAYSVGDTGDAHHLLYTM